MPTLRLPICIGMGELCIYLVFYNILDATPYDKWSQQRKIIKINETLIKSNLIYASVLAYEVFSILILFYLGFKK